MAALPAQGRQDPAPGPAPYQEPVCRGLVVGGRFVGGWLLGGWLVGGWLVGGWLVGGWLVGGWLVGGRLVGGRLVGGWFRSAGLESPVQVRPFRPEHRFPLAPED
jgi:hypothetical protein